jgi:hypothetical protein
VATVDIDEIGRVADLGVTAGRLSDVSGASVAVEDAKAKADGLKVGDKLTLNFARTGPVELTVRALIDRPPPAARRWPTSPASTPTRPTSPTSSIVRSS